MGFNESNLKLQVDPLGSVGTVAPPVVDKEELDECAMVIKTSFEYVEINTNRKEMTPYSRWQLSVPRCRTVAEDCGITGRGPCERAKKILGKVQ